MKTALIIGHPGHELRVLKFIELFKPLVFVLTDGSGLRGQSRLERSRRVFERYGCDVAPLFGRFTDNEAYEMMLHGPEKFVSLRDEILNTLELHAIDFVFGDACEGVEPTHDVCRYMINSCATKMSFLNYEFSLCSTSLPVGPGLLSKLSDLDKAGRDGVLAEYPEMAQEVAMARQRFGDAAFDHEFLSPARIDVRTWGKGIPRYETLGLEMTSKGECEEAITFAHIEKINAAL